MLDDDFRAVPDGARLIRNAQREAEIAASLPASIPFITRFIMAGDKRQGEDALEAVRSGRWSPDQAVVMTGSYGRIDVATTLVAEGYLPDEWLLSEWPGLWRGSDPDDTDPRWWDIWQRAFERNGREPVLDEGVALPGKGNRIRVFRGQKAGDPVGCSWTTDLETAQKFARGAGQRTPLVGGHVLRVVVPKAMVLAYITGRGEHEVILDPREMGWSK